MALYYATSITLKKGTFLKLHLYQEQKETFI